MQLHTATAAHNISSSSASNESVSPSSQLCRCRAHHVAYKAQQVYIQWMLPCTAPLMYPACLLVSGSLATLGLPLPPALHKHMQRHTPTQHHTVGPHSKRSALQATSHPDTPLCCTCSRFASSRGTKTRSSQWHGHVVAITSPPVAGTAQCGSGSMAWARNMTAWMSSTATHRTSSAWLGIPAGSCWRHAATTTAYGSGCVTRATGCVRLCWKVSHHDCQRAQSPVTTDA